MALTKLTKPRARWTTFLLKVAGAASRTLYDKLIERITVRDFGAKGDGVTDDTEAIKTAIAYCKSPRTLLQGVAGDTYLVSETIDIETHFDGRMCTFKAAEVFTGDVVVRINEKSLRCKNFGVRPFNASDKIDGQIGFQVWEYNFKGTDITSSGFDFGMAICSFSCTMINCAATACNTNVTAFAPARNKEINAVNFIGGEYWGSVDYSFNLGDNRFPSPVNPAANHGWNWKIIGVTTDQGVMKLDRVGCIEISCYFEAGVSDKQDAYIYVPNTGGTMAGLNIHDSNCNNKGGGTMDYFIRCDRAVKGIKLDNIQYTGIPKCLLYSIEQDIYPVQIGALFPTASHTEAPSLHLGVRAGQGYGLGAHSVIGSYTNGVAGARGVRIQTNHMYYSQGKHRKYSGSGFVHTGLFSDEVQGIVTGSNKFTVTNLADLARWEAGMCTRSGTAGSGTLSYVMSIDYETGVVELGDYTLNSQTTISAREDSAIWEFYSWKIPDTTDGYEKGSICWNIFTEDQTTTGWILKYDGWTAIT